MWRFRCFGLALLVFCASFAAAKRSFVPTSSDELADCSSCDSSREVWDCCNTFREACKFYPDQGYGPRCQATSAPPPRRDAPTMHDCKKLYQRCVRSIIDSSNNKGIVKCLHRLLGCKKKAQAAGDSAEFDVNTL